MATGSTVSGLQTDDDTTSATSHRSPLGTWERAWQRPRIQVDLRSWHRIVTSRGRIRVAEIAAVSGCYDQAHPTNDVRELSGLSPYSAARLPAP